MLAPGNEASYAASNPVTILTPVMKMDNNIRALALLSSGLDGQLAACLVRDQGIEVDGVVFTHPIAEIDQALAGGREVGIPVEQVDFTMPLVDVFEKCASLDLSGDQLCLDVHAEMLKRALELAEEKDYAFVCTGDVLDQRGPTQSHDALEYIRQYVEKGDCILRPLSARLLPQTLPEREGWVQRDELLAIEGNNRAEQRRLAETYGLTQFADPSRVSRLTDPAFADRLRDLRAHEGLQGKRALALLRLGRHFRLGPVTKLVVGRNETENAELEGNAELYDLILKLEDVPGPTGLLPINATEDQVRLGAAICARYSDVDSHGQAPVRVRSARESRRIEVTPAASVDIDLLRI